MVGELFTYQPEYEGLGLDIHLRDDIARTLEPDALFALEPLSRELTGELRRLPRHLEGCLAAGS